MPPRLATHMLVTSLIRRVSAAGDFATVLKKGDPTAGTLLLVARQKGRFQGLFEQMPTPEGAQNWVDISPQASENEQQISDYLDRRTARDPDIWILELDVAFAERLTGLLASPS